MLEVWDYAILGLVGLFTTLVGLFLAFRVAKPGLTKQIRAEAMTIGNQVAKSLAETIENVDVEEILGKIPAAGGGGEGIGALAGVAESFGIDLGPLAGIGKLLGGKNKEGGGSTGW